MSSIIVDIETYAHELATEFIPPPDLDAIEPRGGLKDPVKIAASIAEKKAEALDAYQTALSRAALDWNVSRIVALGWQLIGCEPVCRLCHDEDEERDALVAFWRASSQQQLIGFCARTFDLPTLIQRSRLLGISPNHVSLGRYGRGDVIDLFDMLTFDDPRRSAAVMPQNLKAFARRFGIPYLDPCVGKDVAGMVKDGDWEGVRAHCLSDIDITRALAIKLRVIRA